MSQFMKLFELFFKSQFTKSRIAIAIGLGALALVLAVLSAAQADDKLEAGVTLIATFGYSVMLPFITLTLVAGMIGQLKEDETLVYIWLTPASRFTTALSAVSAAVLATIPLIVIPLGVVAGISTQDAGVVVYTMIGAFFGAAAYGALFAFFGLLTKFSTFLGIAYILIWEGLIVAVLARQSTALLATSPAAQARKILFQPVDGLSSLQADLAAPTGSLPAALITLLVLTALGAWVTSWRLQSMEVA